MAEALVEYDYKAQELDELTIKKGDIITNISFKPGGWWEGTLLNGGKRGMFPDNFVKLIKTEDGVAPTAASSGRRCKVLFPYSAAKEDELDLQVGDIIDIISEVEEGWWKGSLKNRIGVFPSNFVAEITDAKPEKEAALRKSKISRDESVKQPLGMNSGNSNSDTQSSLKSESPSSDLPVLPPKPAKEYCRVMYKYEAANKDELTLHRGDIITIITKEGQDPGWWKGELKGEIGVFPDNFVEIITAEEATKTELKTKVSNRLGMAISKSATTSSISDTLNLNSLSRKFSDSSKSSEDRVPPSVSKKPVLPPPPNKKPSPSLPSAKIIESSQSGQASGKVLTSSSTTIKHGSSLITETSTVSSSSSKWTIVESGDSADGVSWSKQSYSLKNDKKSENSGNSVTSVSMTNTESSSDLNLDMVGRSSKKLTHPTATRAKAPKRRPPSTLITKENLSPTTLFEFDLKNGAEEYEDEEESPEDPLVNGDADSHVEKTSNTPPWVEELKLNQAKKSLQNSMQGKTRVVIGMSSSTSERSISEKTVSERTVTEKNDKAVSEKSERAFSEKVISEKAISPESRAALVTLRQQPIVGQRPQSMISNFRTSSSPPLYSTLSSESITISLKQWNDLLEKVSLLEANFETQIGALTKAVNDLTGKLDDERQRRMVMQQELEKLTDLVTQV